MKLFSLIFLLSVSVFALDPKNKKLTPFQERINECFSGQIDVKNLVDLKQVYLEIVRNFPLRASETTYREVIYRDGNEKRKLRLEDGVVQIFKIEADDKVTLISTENITKDAPSDKLRYKTKSPEARLDQLLNRGEIKSDFIKTNEYRSKQLVLNLVWSDGLIREMSVQFGAEKRKLDCQKKSAADICDCHN
jgi:hypothetical protein